MLQQIFCDEITSISIVDGTVRLDMTALSPTEKDRDGNATLVFVGRVAMSVDAFLRSAPRLEEAHRILQRQRDAHQKNDAFVQSPAGLEAAQFPSRPQAVEENISHPELPLGTAEPLFP